MKDLKQKMPFLMVKSIKSILLILTYLIDFSTEMVMILNIKLLNIEAVFVLVQKKFTLLSIVLISLQVKVTKNNN